MKEFILENLSNAETLNFGIIVLNSIVSFIMAFFVMFVYKLTYSGPAYSRKFNISIGMITIVTTMIMSIISSNIALSLGMVGALSIIRFRTAIKDVRDATFVFWVIAIGIGCGVSQYMLVGIGSITVFIFMISTKQVVTEGHHLLVVSVELSTQNKVEAAIVNYFGKDAHLKMKNANRESCEFVYGIESTKLKKAIAKNQIDVVEKLLTIKGIYSVNIVEQLDDIGR